MSGRGNCRSCGAPVVWLVTSTGRRMPVNAETAKPNDAWFSVEKGHISHFSSCPQAEKWRRRETHG